MKVFKFGGASLKSPTAIRNAGKIIKEYSEDQLLIVVSAMGKTTNALEKTISLFRSGKNYEQELTVIINYHTDIIDSLFSATHGLHQEIKQFQQTIQSELKKDADYDVIYDQVVSCGELMSSRIVSEYLNSIGIKTEWIDARQYISTDDCFREGKVNWELTKSKTQSLKEVLSTKIILTQGFIGSTGTLTTTLGREGSDFSAAIFASCLDATSVTIWKDVPGVMSADPKRLSDAITFDELPFREAAEMTYFGASVIHPKTIKPLANKGIPLLVKSFDDSSLPGTVIHECKVDNLPPLIVFKDNQCLISCQVTDYTFIDEQQISIILNALSARSLKMNMMQNSAISFSFCLDFNESKVLGLIEHLSEQFEVYYNTGLTLITVKNYDQKAFDQYRKHAGVILEQSSRSTLQVLVRS